MRPFQNLSKLTLALHAVGMVTLAALAYQLCGFYHDDAFITLRYAINWRVGLGPVWNPGETVQGYTNFLHLALLTLLSFCGVDLVAASHLVCVAGYVAVLWLLARAFHLRDDHTSEAALSGVLSYWLAATSVPLVGWAFGGLETTLAAALLLGAVLLTLELFSDKRPVPVRPVPAGVVFFKDASVKLAAAAGLCFSLAMLARPDMGLFAAISLAAIFVRFSRAWRVPAAFVLALLALQVPYQLWRVSFYGEWLPNTYWAKVGGIPREWLLVNGAYYVLQWVLMFPLLPVLALVLAGWMLLSRRMDFSTFYVLALVLAAMGYLVWAGGDHMPYLRFAAPFVPLVTLLIFRALAALKSAGHGKWVRDIASAMLLFIPAQMGYASSAGLSGGALSGMSVAEYMAAHFPPNTLVAINPSGALPYMTPQLRYVDMLGLNDATIARRPIHELQAPAQGTVGHMKGNGDYVLSRRPDVIIFGMNWGAPADAPMFLSDLELSKNPQFAAEYEPVVVWLAEPASLEKQLKALAADPAQAENYRLRLNVLDELRFVYFKRKTKGL